MRRPSRPSSATSASRWTASPSATSPRALLGFFLDEIAPTVYNQAVADVQERLQLRVSELDLEVHEDEFGYWRKYDQAPGRRRLGISAPTNAVAFDRSIIGGATGTYTIECVVN